MKKYIYHITCGVAVGGLQCILSMGFSYLLLFLDLSTIIFPVLYVFFHSVVVSIAVGNILYKAHTFLAVFLRIVSSVFSFALIMFSFVHLDVALQLEKLLNISKSSSAQGVQGMIFLSFLLWIAIASFFAVVLTSIKIYQAQRYNV